VSLRTFTDSHALRQHTGDAVLRQSRKYARSTPKIFRFRGSG